MLKEEVPHEIPVNLQLASRLFRRAEKMLGKSLRV